jgi:hypothetical protein
MLDIVANNNWKDLFTLVEFDGWRLLAIRLVYKLIPVKNPTTEDGNPLTWDK